jgi:hypothetical protein
MHLLQGQFNFLLSPRGLPFHLFVAYIVDEEGQDDMKIHAKIKFDNLKRLNLGTYPQALAKWYQVVTI